jgi:hypothetical protein
LKYFGTTNQINIWLNEYNDQYNNIDFPSYLIQLRTRNFKDYKCEIPNIFSNVFYGCDLEIIHPFTWIKLVFNEILSNSDYNDIISFISIYYPGERLESIVDWTNRISNLFNTKFINDINEIEIKQEEENVKLNFIIEYCKFKRVGEVNIIFSLIVDIINY